MGMCVCVFMKVEGRERETQYLSFTVKGCLFLYLVFKETNGKHFLLLVYRVLAGYVWKRAFHDIYLNNSFCFPLHKFF